MLDTPRVLGVEASMVLEGCLKIRVYKNKVPWHLLLVKEVVLLLVSCISWLS